MSDEQVNQAIESTLSVVDSSDAGARVMTLSTGVVVKFVTPPTMALQTFRQKHPKPTPPMVRVEDGGTSWLEANPNDPAYKEAVEAYGMETAEALLRLMLWTSCHIMSLPEGMKNYEEDDEWAEEAAELLDVEVPTTPRLRKVAWLRYRIFARPNDFDLLQKALTELTGTPEEMIKSAEASFRS